MNEVMNGTEGLKEKVLSLLEEKKNTQLTSLLREIYPADLVLLFEAIREEPKMPLIFRLLTKETAAETFVLMDSDIRELLLKSLSDKELREMLDEFFVDDTVDIIEEMPANVVTRILKNTDPETRKNINAILEYPQDSAGSIMTIEYVDLKENLTVADAFGRIRKVGVDKETIYTCYVTDEKRMLIGLVTVKALLLANRDALLSEVMEHNVISVKTTDDREEVAMMFDKYDFLALPVVDMDGRLVGIVTVDDAIDVMREEITEDIEKMAAVLPSETSYLKRTIFEIFKSRIPWLLILMVSATFTGMIITHFEQSLAACVVLTAYIPMLMDTGGNCGSQSSVTVIRAMSLGEIGFKNFFVVLFKELRVSLLCAAVLGIANFAKLLFLDRIDFPVALTVCLALTATIVIAKLVGASLPILAQKLGFDPAVMASPFITTIVDAVSLLIYFFFAGVILKI